jgi:glutaredoxin-like YruB-family protein
MAIKVYSTPTCGYCKLLKEYLREKGVEFQDYDVSVDEHKRNEMVQMTGQMGVPVVDVNGKVMIGFDKSTLDTLLAG